MGGITYVAMHNGKSENHVHLYIDRGQTPEPVCLFRAISVCIYADAPVYVYQFSQTPPQSTNYQESDNDILYKVCVLNSEGTYDEVLAGKIHYNNNLVIDYRHNYSSLIED